MKAMPPAKVGIGQIKLLKSFLNRAGGRERGREKLHSKLNQSYAKEMKRWAILRLNSCADQDTATASPDSPGSATGAETPRSLRYVKVA